MDLFFLGYGTHGEAFFAREGRSGKGLLNGVTARAEIGMHGKLKS
jgi:hypothetical protein